MKNILILMALFWVGMGTALAQKSPVFTTSAGAIRGYDPVAYFKESKPILGKSALTYVWQGASWHFATQQNLDAFRASPETFAPQYGGYCAYGTAGGYKAPIDPQAWTLAGGKLYLNYSKDVQQTWSKDQKAFIQKADQHWPRIKDKP